MRRSFLVLVFCSVAGNAVAQNERIVFPVPGREDSQPTATFFDEAYKKGQAAHHLGVDIPALEGTVVVSPVDGTVLLNRTNISDPYLAYLVIKSQDNGFEHVLAHIRSDIRASSFIKAGDPVGKIVTAGTGPHLHYGVNQKSVASAIDIANGWGFGRAPKTSTASDGRAKGWLDPMPFLSGEAKEEAMDAIPEWDESLVAGMEAEYMPCGKESTSAVCLRRLGLGEQATSFSYVMDQDYSGATTGVSFMELGAVDLAVAQYIGADIHLIPVLVNGTVGLHAVNPSDNMYDTFADGVSWNMLRNFPEAFTDGMEISAHRLLPDGTQRFVMVERVLNGCRACELIGQAITFIEVDPNAGGQIRRQPIGLLIGRSQMRDDPITAEILLSMPEVLQSYLNSLGYKAGPMDGNLGQQTQIALRGFQADYCLNPSGFPDRTTINALLTADGFQRPCTGKAVDRADAGLEVPSEAPVTVYITPERGSPLRKDIADAVRPLAVREFSGDIEFIIDEMRVAGTLAYVDLWAQRPGGSDIVPETTPMHRQGRWFWGGEDQRRVSGFLRKENGRWQAYDIVFGSSEAWWVQDCSGLDVLMAETCSD